MMETLDLGRQRLRVYDLSIKTQTLLRLILNGEENLTLKVSPFTHLSLICGLIVNMLPLMLYFRILIVKKKIGLISLVLSQESFCSCGCMWFLTDDDFL